MIFTPPFLGMITPHQVASMASVSLNGAANDVYIDPASNIAYVVGAFTTVTDASGTVTRNRAAALDLASGLWSSWNPNCDATLARIVSDGADGLYLCGNLTVCGGHTTKACALVSKATGAVDTAFAVTATTLGRTVALNAGDLFMGSNGTVSLGKYSATTGVRDTSWVVSVASSSINGVSAVGTDLLVVGGFTTIQSQVRNRGASVALSNAAIGSWNPNVSGGTGSVLGVLVDPTNGVSYLYGGFTTVGGSTRNGVAQVDTSTGGLQTWAMNAATTGTVNSTTTDGTDVWLGGTFTVLDGSTRNRVGKGDRATGTLNATWNPNCNGNVTLVAYGQNSTVLVFGTFTTIGGQSRTNFAVLNAITGNAY